MSNNKCTTLTYESIFGSSWIDLILCKNINSTKIGKYEVNTDINMSDHNLLTFNLHFNKYYNRSFKMDFKRINIWNFSIDLTKLLKNKKLSIENEDMEDMLEQLKTDISVIYNKNKFKMKKKKNLILWDTELQVERNRVRALRKIYQSERDINRRKELCDKFKKARPMYKKHIILKRGIVLKNSSKTLQPVVLLEVLTK